MSTSMLAKPLSAWEEVCQWRRRGHLVAGSSPCQADGCVDFCEVDPCELTGGHAWTKRPTGHWVGAGGPKGSSFGGQTLAGAVKGQQECAPEERSRESSSRRGHGEIEGIGPAGGLMWPALMAALPRLCPADVCSQSLLRPLPAGQPGPAAHCGRRGGPHLGDRAGAGCGLHHLHRDCHPAVQEVSGPQRGRAR